MIAKQGNYWYHFYNVFGITRSLTWWLNPGPHALEASTLPLGYRGHIVCVFVIVCCCSVVGGDTFIIVIVFLIIMTLNVHCAPPPHRASSKKTIILLLKFFGIISCSIPNHQKLVTIMVMNWQNMITTKRSTLNYVRGRS